MAFRIWTIAAAAVLFASPAYAAPAMDLITAIQRIQMPGISMTYEGVVARLSDPIRNYDLNGDGLDAKDLDLLAQVRVARIRAGSAARFLIFDLDNDRTVSRGELEQVYRLSGNSGLDQKQMRGLFASADADDNGVLDWDEMSAVPGGNAQNDGNLQGIMAFDPTPDTGLTLADAKTLADRVFASFDSDKNGILDQAELAAARGRPLI